MRTRTLTANQDKPIQTDMKITTSLKIAGAVLASTLSVLAARADLAINENVSLLGYAAGSVQYNKVPTQNTDTTADIDVAKIGVALNFEPITANVSICTDTGAKDLYLLDAYVSYDFSHGLTASAGRFVTYLGYESFDLPENTFITYGVANIGGVANMFPSYHQGVKIEYANGKTTLGLALVDSVYNLRDGEDFYRGDGDVRDGFGIEGNFTHAEEQWTLGLTLAYQYAKAGYQSIDGIDPYAADPETFTADIWLERNIGDITLAAEVAMKRENDKFSQARNTYYVALMAKQDLSDKISLAGRLSYGNEKDFGNFWKLSVMPVGYEISNNFSIRSEVSYTRYGKSIRALGEPKYEFFAGVQAVFKF
ncbi:MAG: porin [Opitutaceae bacterium]|nr:porin [Opitutaceae bacterium]